MCENWVGIASVIHINPIINFNLFGLSHLHKKTNLTWKQRNQVVFNNARHYSTPLGIFMPNLCSPILIGCLCVKMLKQVSFRRCLLVFVCSLLHMWSQIFSMFSVLSVIS